MAGRTKSAFAICPLCGGTQLRILLELRGNICICICPTCTNAMTFPPPMTDYDNHQFFALAEKAETRWRGYMRPIIRFIGRHYGLSGRLLDVGCSHGLLIEEAGLAGFDAEGIEPSRQGVAYCQKRGLRVRHGYLSDDVFPPNSFDVIVMSHVLEHVADPTSLLKAVAKILKPQGVVCLSQTNYQGTLPCWLGRRWGGWVPQEHHYHFSSVGICHVLQKAGFQKLELELLPLGYDLDFAIQTPRMLFGAVLNTFSFLVSRLQIGWPFQGDQMYVLAQLASYR